MNILHFAPIFVEEVEDIEDRFHLKQDMTIKVVSERH